MGVRKKPIVVDAFQLKDDWFDSGHPNPQHIVGFMTDPETRTVVIPTLEGNHTARIGDWIIKGVKGEYYPCKPDIFEQTYEFVDEITLVPEPASLLELCRNILELARHGDYSNGNTAQGMDEGQVMAGQMMADYEQQISNFERGRSK